MLSRFQFLLKNRIILTSFMRQTKIYNYQPCYYFAKIGKKKQEKLDKKAEKENLNLDRLIDIGDVQKNFNNCISEIKDRLAKQKFGRLTPESLDNLQISCYGQKNALQTLAQISVKSHNVLTLNVFDESIIDEIQKVLENSDLNFQLKKQGKIITCTQIGSNTKELKLKAVKQLKTDSEDQKQKLRKIRAEGIKKLKPYELTASQDSIKAAEKEIESFFEKAITDLENLLKQKEKEIMNA